MARHRTVLECSYADDSRAAIIATSVGREIGEIDDDRSRTTIDRQGATVEVVIDARDVTALRAAVNTWFSLLDVAERTHELGRRFA